jgi:hypothetical protein
MQLRGRIKFWKMWLVTLPGNQLPGNQLPGNVVKAEMNPA